MGYKIKEDEGRGPVHAERNSSLLSALSSPIFLSAIFLSSVFPWNRFEPDGYAGDVNPVDCVEGSMREEPA